jgi:hypothetical protein
VSGKVVDGWSVLDKVEAAAVAAGGVSEEPTVPVVVADCGLLWEYSMSVLLLDIKTNEGAKLLLLPRRYSLAI